MAGVSCSAYAGCVSFWPCQPKDLPCRIIGSLRYRTRGKKFNIAFILNLLNLYLALLPAKIHFIALPIFWQAKIIVNNEDSKLGHYRISYFVF
jgi:hypothetical protein